jgi:hypothetical protein
MHSYNLATGTWTQWSQWTTCSKTCGVEESKRSRSCQGGSCSGISSEENNATITMDIEDDYYISGSLAMNMLTFYIYIVCCRFIVFMYLL